jgi:hypothetical protein
MRGQEAMKRLGRSAAYAVRTSHVLFLLLPSEAHLNACEQAIGRLSERWAEQFTIDVMEAASTGAPSRTACRR